VDYHQYLGLFDALGQLNAWGHFYPIWLHRYNWHRPHGSLKAQTPISRLGLSEDNLFTCLRYFLLALCACITRPTDPLAVGLRQDR
jgi:hypothetical protein